ncbi:MAG: hypothetical protein IPI11_15915 [Haliscomenobacter sp.]|nr:hypothetical protein [Haliscomenobacter sp.]
MRLVLSPVGTSILTNQAGEHRSTLNEYANAQEQDMPQNVIGLVGELHNKALEKLDTASLSELQRDSAELNGIIGLYDNNLPEQSNDMHILVATDTYQGKATAGIVEKVLKKHFVNTQTYTPQGLNTNSKTAFLEAIKDLLKWCDETLPGYRTAGYEIIFNLTGASKVCKAI